MRDRLLGVASDLEATIVMPEIAEADIDEDLDGMEPGDAVENVVDVTNDHERSTPRSNVFGEPLEEPDLLDDPSYEELWEGTRVLDLDLPDIPRLDLFWADGPDDPSPE